MLYIDNRNITDPALNLALEEYILRQLPGENDYLLFYINEPSIIIGKNQNTAEEVNRDYVEANGIHVVRRLSGGGAVYHDQGNLNFSFITRDDGKSFNNYRKFTEPVVRALHQLGVQAELSGRNDIQVGERKISGNAQFSTRGRMFTHGTLLFDSQIDHVVSALNVNPLKIQSKGVKSVRSRVANISEFLDKPMTVAEFKAHLLHSIFAGAVPTEYKLTEADWAAVHRLADERYRSWDWNYGQSPAFNVHMMKRLPAGTFDVRLDVEEGLIRSAAVYGDFFGVGDVQEFAARLAGVRYDAKALSELLEVIDLPYYFGPVTKEEWLGLLL
ncbi:Lipoate-protein ligase LplJ [Paenibacillus konkukensis]|uniref:lipoate--protein ligase n=1 Tax=Paenibacillus konkukensis TaxID=2020716 RepID=A0ABY4RGU8_9BACL|nr:lipoate--protein ligase [Paenibacillus konkukensis]UQZ81438.1 Lipoate-protein ligase LplJ [Paenibacillus konkukensis]